MTQCAVLRQFRALWLCNL